MCARNPKKSVWISVENTTNSIMDEKKTPQIKRQKSIDSAVNMNGDETDGVPTRIAMPVAERRRHFRKMQSMGSLCNTPVMFSLTNQVTSVAQALKAVKNSNGSDTLARSLTRSLSIHRSTSRDGRCCHCGDDAEKFDSEDSSELLNRLVHKLQKQMDYMEKSLSNQFETYISCGEKETKETTEKRYEVPWFPRKIADLDLCVNRVIPADLPEDYIGYKDNQYRERRSVFAELAYKHKYGQPVPRVEYTEQEKNTWRLVFSELIDLYPKYACKEYLENIQSLREAGVYCEDQVPQLEDVSAFLKERTGFQIRPVSGYLSSRDFLAGLAFRTFACTQYIRHSEETFYTSEPDICHELMGHVPMFADKSFAQFSQEIGLASLGASDEDIKNLASCYFFTIEFGLCKQNGQTKVYGAGLLSSSDELKHAMEVDLKPFTPDGAIEQECRISTFQDAYFITDSFTGAKNLMREYAGKVQRPFTVRYDPYTQSIDVLDSVDEMVSMVGGLKDDLRLLTHALAKIQSLEMDSR